METNTNNGRFKGCIPSYGDAGVCAAVMDTNRESWQRPDIVSRLITQPNMTVVDLGAGTGYFADMFSKQLPEGKIIALDPETSLITWMEERKQKDFLDNVSIHKITKDDPGLDQLNGEIDLLFVGYTYFHFDEPVYIFVKKFILIYRMKQMLQLLIWPLLQARKARDVIPFPRSRLSQK